MSTNYRRIVLPALALAALATAEGGEPGLPGDGWVSWQVAAPDAAPAWCCFSSWNDRDPSRMSCKLDGESSGFSIGNGDETTDSVKIYVRTTRGKIDRLQALAASCPVETATPIQPLEVTSEDSTRWLSARVRSAGSDAKTGRPLGEAALAALALHRGDQARDALVEFAHDADVETRKWSVFWLALLRGPQGADITSTVMFSDADAEVREHAALALSQSKAPRVVPDLIKLGSSDEVGDVRARAWFWLAQLGAPQAEQAIGAAVRKDPDDDVREQAIFALSRLPDERGPKALIAVAEDRSLAHEQRKRAVFWLSQSESESAQAYLDKVLAGNH